MVSLTPRHGKTQHIRATSEDKYLTFKLVDDVYAAPVIQIQEITPLLPITEVPQVPDYIAGVINLRGKVTSVLDLRKKFQLANAKRNKRNCLIVTEIEHNNEHIIMAMLVDEVLSVQDLYQQHIDPAPSYGNHIDTTFIKGIGKTNDETFIILNIENILTHQQKQIVLDMEHQAAANSTEQG